MTRPGGNVAGALALSVGAGIGHHVQVDANGNIAGPATSAAWWNVLSDVFFALLTACWLGSLVGQVASYRRSSGERRQQLKWLAGGVAAVLAAFAARLKEAVDLDSVRDDLASVVQQALEPAHVSVWMSERG